MSRGKSKAARLGPWLIAALLAGVQVCAPAAAADRDWSAPVVEQFRAAGLQPAAGRSYLQPLKLRQQTLAVERSSVALVEGGDTQLLVLGRDLFLDPTARQPERIAAPLVFVGSREPGPAMLRELEGKIVVMMARDAAAMAPAAWLTLERSGAVGFLTIAGRAAPAPQAGAVAYLAEDAPVRLAGTIGADAAGRLFAGSGRDYAELLALSEAGRSLPSFGLSVRLKASLAVQTRNAAAANVVGMVRGSDPMLAREYVVVSADAASAGAVLDAVRRLHSAAISPKRSVLFAVFAPEQQGALGARAFAARPPVPRDDMVAHLSAVVGAGLPDASVAIAGGEETSLGAVARDLAAGARLTLAPGGSAPAWMAAPYGFLASGVPALRLTFAAAAPDPAYLLAIALKVADNDAHPAWVRGSRFAPRAPQAQELVTAPVEMPLGRRPRQNLGGYAWLGTALAPRS